jgi:hypothetical protein
MSHKCNYCHDQGAVFMREVDGAKYCWTYACICDTGTKFSESNKVKVWNGQITDMKVRDKRNILLNFDCMERLKQN